MSVPVRSDARANVRGFLSPSAHEGTQTRRDELVGTLSNQQIWGEQEPNVRLPSAKRKLLKMTSIAQNELETQWTPLSEPHGRVIWFDDARVVAFWIAPCYLRIPSSQYLKTVYHIIILSILKLLLPFISNWAPFFFHPDKNFPYNDVVNTQVRWKPTALAENHGS